MGITEFIYIYKNEEEKVKINNLIVEYQRRFAFLHAINTELTKVKSYIIEEYYRRCETMDCPWGEDWENYPTKEQIMKELPDVNYEYLDTDELQIKSSGLLADNYIKYHQNIVMKSGSNAIRVFFHYGGAWYTFGKYMKNNGIEHYPGSSDYSILERYDCITEDIYGNSLIDAQHENFNLCICEIIN